MTIDSVTAVQYSGYLNSEIRKLLDSGKVNPATEEVRIQRILEEQRKRIQPIYETKGKIITQNEPSDNLKKFEETMKLIKQYPVKSTRTLPFSRPYEIDEPGKLVNIII